MEVRGTRPVVVPVRWPVKADLDGAARPTELETAAELVAWPHLSRFHLYRARHRPGSVVAGTRTVEVTAAGGSSGADAIAALPRHAHAWAELDRLRSGVPRAERLSAWVMHPALIRTVGVSSDREDDDRGEPVTR